MAMTLKALRVNRGLTQIEAAEKMDVNPATISNWEMGKTMPSRKMLETICDVYGCTVDDISFAVNVNKE